MNTGAPNPDADGGSLSDDASSEKQESLPPRIRSEELFQGQVEVLISHGSHTYRLRRTRSGKLILQK